jgi:GxxExxY protein
MGPGLLESAYEACLGFELRARGHTVEQQRPLPVLYKGTALDCAYRMDLVIDERVVVEVKAVEQLLPVHEAQLLSYLRLSGLPLGLLINFHSATVKQGIRRLRNFKPLSVPSLPSALSVTPSSASSVRSVVKTS